MLTTVRSVAIVDRTGAIQESWRVDDVDLFELAATELDCQPPDVDVLLVGARELTAAGRRRVARWRQWQPAGVTIAHVDGLEVDRTLLRSSGVDHVIRGRLTTAKLSRAMRDADADLADLVAATQRLHGTFSSYAEEPADVESADECEDEEVADDSSDSSELIGADLARLITVASATGGCGKTFYATNLASLFASAGARVLLVDLDLQFGEVAAALQVQHAYSLYDGLYGTSGERLPASAMREHLDELVHHHPLGFDVLTAPRDPVLADFVGARDATTLLDAVLPRYDLVIADTPPSLNDVVIAALDRSDAVLVLATLDVPSLRNLTSFLDVLRRLSLDDERVRLVLNKADRDVGVTVEQANDAFGGRFATVLPTDRAVSRSVNLGTTVVVHEPRSKVSRALLPAVRSLIAELGYTTPDSPSDSSHSTARSASFLGAFRRLLSGGSA